MWAAVVFVLFVLLTIALLASGGTTTIRITASGFSPRRIIIQKGDTVKWVNDDAESHRVVSDGGFFDSGVLGPGESYSFTFDRYPPEGREFPYHDGFDVSITGTVCIEYCNDARWYVFLPLVMRNAP